MRVRHAALGALLTIGALAAPAGAQAASLGLLPAKACYGAAEKVSLFGTGFTPGGPVTVRQGLMTLNPGPTVDATGSFAGKAFIQQISAKEETTNFNATDQNNPAITIATGPLRVSQLSLSGTKAGANGLIQRIRARGFTSGRKVLYAHVRRGGRKIKNLRIGRLQGACRTLNVRKRFFSSGANPGVYTLYFDTARRFKKGRSQQPRGTLTVFRIVRRSAAGARAATSSQSGVFTSPSAIGSWR